MQALMLAEKKDRDPFGSPKYTQVRLFESILVEMFETLSDNF
jgi:hypothetical protein